MAGAGAAGAAAAAAAAAAQAGAAQAAGAAPPGEEGEGSEEEEEEEPRREYPPRPQRSMRLPDLLRAAGLAEQAAVAPDVMITDIVTCNSESAGPGALYVCVPATDVEDDGHNYIPEVGGWGTCKTMVWEFWGADR